MSYKIGIDISGGDFAPKEIFKGAILARRDLEAEIVLIGDKKEIEKEAQAERVDLDNFIICDAPEKITMEEQAAMSIRRKKQSSIVMGINQIREERIDAFVSCGNTGAVVSAATLMLGIISGVERPGIAIFLPTTQGPALLIDAGANINPKPLHLLQYGIMASLYYSTVFNKPNPRLGLLNIGEEETKGSDFVKIVHKLFTNSSLNFIGNVEARDIFSGKCDCVVCDGFVGNITLKVSEGVGEVISKFLLDSVKNDLWGKLGMVLMRKSLKKFKQIVDYAEYGGAPLLGVNGVVIIGHGRSSAYAVRNAVKVALQELKRKLIDNIKGKLYEICEDSRVREALTS